MVLLDCVGDALIWTKVGNEGMIGSICLDLIIFRGCCCGNVVMGLLIGLALI